MFEDLKVLRLEVLKMIGKCKVELSNPGSPTSQPVVLTSRLEAPTYKESYGLFYEIPYHLDADSILQRFTGYPVE